MKKIDLQKEDLSERDKKMMEVADSREVEGTYFTNPKEFINAMDTTPSFRKALATRVREIKAVNKGQNIDEDDLLHFFRQTDGYKTILWKFLADNPLKYDEKQYTTDFVYDLDDYWTFVRGMKQKERYQRFGSVEEVEKERSMRHLRAARQLVEDDMVENEKIGRLIVHFLSIDQGYDHVDFERDERRRAILN